MRLVVGISGATGAIYGVRLMEALHANPEVETHLVITEPGKLTIEHELGISVKEVESLACVVHHWTNIGASISSGSFKTGGMVIAPCSIKTLSALANSYNDNLLVRAGDATLKEGRPLIVVVRETPLHVGHLRLMTQLAEMGGVLLPPVPAFYHHPKTIDDIVNHTVGKILDRLGLEHNLFERWAGISGGQGPGQTR